MYNLLGEARGLMKPEPYLDREEVLRYAFEDTGLSDLGASFDSDLLDLLLESARVDTDFTFLGRRAFFYSLGTTLAIRLHFIEAQKRHPEIFAAQLLPPMLVMGSPRSGTTLLQSLLALHEAYRPPQNWELRRPVPPWALDRAGKDRRLELAERAHGEYRRYTRTIDQIHFTRPTTPGECIILMLLTLRSGAFWGGGPIYSYMEALMWDDGRARYAEYVELLKLLQYAEPRRALLLKAPEHTPYLDRVAEALPGAAIVQMHRDPVVAAVSLMSLFRNNHANVVKRLDLDRTAELTLKLMDHGIQRNLAARETYGDVVHDVHYRSLVDDPVGTVRRIFERFDVPWPRGHERRLTEYLAANPQGKYGRHRYHAAEFGLTEETIRRRLSAFYDNFDLARTA